MEKFILTFGVKYNHETHPRWTAADGRGWVSIHATSEDDARRIAHTFFGPYWGFIYPDYDFVAKTSARFYPLGELLHMTQVDGPQVAEVRNMHGEFIMDPQDAPVPVERALTLAEAEELNAIFARTLRYVRDDRRGDISSADISRGRELSAKLVKDLREGGD